MATLCSCLVASGQDADRPSRSEDAKQEHKHDKDKGTSQGRSGCFHPADVHSFTFRAAYRAPERETWVQTRCKYSLSARSCDVEYLCCKQNISVYDQPSLLLPNTKGSCLNDASHLSIICVLHLCLDRLIQQIYANTEVAYSSR